MSARRILLLDTVHLSAWRWANGHLQSEGEFAHDPAGVEAFIDYLRQHRESLYYVLAEVGDEGFQHENLPHVSGRDRAAIVKRKLGQYYYGTPLSLALSLGRLKEGRRDDHMLFVGLTRPQVFEPWLAALTAAEVAVAGVYSIPLVVSPLVADKLGAHQRFLLITLTAGGLRQTFFDDGRLRFSRLTVLATGSIDESSVACAAEADKIYQYLAGQRLLTRGATLPVYVLAHPAQTNAFRNRCRDTDELRFDYLDLLAAASRLGLKLPLQDSRADALFAHLLVRNTPREQFAPESARHFYRVWQLRTALYASGAIVFAACMLFAGKQFIEASMSREDAAVIKSQTESDTRRYQDILRALPKVPLDNEALRALTGRYQELVRRSPGPEPSFLRLSATLRDHPYVELERLDWGITNRPDDAPIGVAGGAPPPGSPNASASPPPAGAAADSFATLDVHGLLPLAMASDPRAQQEALERFARALRSDSATHVRILSRPFDAESGKSIKSSGDTAAIAAPKFSLRIARKL